MNIELTKEELRELRIKAEEMMQCQGDESYVNHFAFYVLELLKEKGVI